MTSNENRQQAVSAVVRPSTPRVRLALGAALAAVLLALFGQALPGGGPAVAEAAPKYKRIVALTPFAGNALASMGVFPKALGQTLGGDRRYVSGLRTTPRLAMSHPRGPNMEKLARLRPDLIFTSPQWSAGKEFMESIARRVVVVDPKSIKEARKYAAARVAASNEADAHTRLPSPASWQLGPDAQYVHVCSNETINGVEFHELPDLRALGCDAPLVIDFSSHVASRPVDWSRVGLAFGGAQKNLGPAGLTLVVVREDLLGHAMSACPSAFDYKMVADNGSMYNTPPTYAIYMAGLTFQWLKRQTEGKLSGVPAIEQRNIAKANLLYDCIDGSQLYENKVDKNCRSRMNVPFFLRDASRNDAFLAGAQAAGLLQLKGHKSVGGMRASIYNAMPLEGVQALVSYMRDFEKTQA